VVVTAHPSAKVEPRLSSLTGARQRVVLLSVQRGAVVRTPAHGGHKLAATHLGVPPRRRESCCSE
jgi:hypothetical protein